MLNTTVGGRLIATVPVGHVCHKGGPFAAYDEAACEELGNAFMDEAPATLFVLSLIHFIPLLEPCINITI